MLLGAIRLDQYRPLVKTVVVQLATIKVVVDVLIANLRNKLRPVYFSFNPYQDSILDLFLFFKFSLFQGYRIYGFTFPTLCTKVSYTPECMWSKEIRFTAFPTLL